MKKLFTIGLVGVTIAWTIGLAAVVTVPVRAAAAGDLIKMAGNPAVYYLGSDSKRYVFPTQSTYMTWYKDFSGVVTISQSELESYSLGGNVTVRAGTKLVKITTDPKTYAVESGGTLRWVKTEAIAKSLWGDLWYKRVIDVPDPFWVNYTAGSDLDTATYPNGTLVKATSGSTTYYIDGGKKRPIADEAAFNANKFNWDNLVTAADLSGYADGSSLSAAESGIITVAGPGVTVTPGAGGTLTVSLASDTPAAATVVKSSTLVKFTKVNFTASGGDVTVDSITIKRQGLAQDSNFSNVYLIGETNTMHGNEKTLSSTHTAIVNDDFTVKDGTTKTYYVAATMASSLQAGEVAQLGISEVVVKNNATVSGTFPVAGNSMTMNNTISLGTVTPSDGALATTASKPVGTTDYTFSSTKLTVNSTEDVQVERIRFYQSGTAADADLANLDLVVDGVVLATVAKATDKYVDFNLSSSPYTIGKGLDKTFAIQGDIANGSSRTVDFEIYNKTDILVKGKTYGFYINPAWVNTSAPYWTQSYVTTVSTGTLTVSKKVLSSTYIAEGATGQTLGAFAFRAAGEPIIITQLVMEVTTSTAAGAITNMTVYDGDNKVVAGPQDPTSGSDPDTVTFTDTVTVPVGETVYTVKGNLDSNFANGDTVRMDINTPATKITAKGETTNNSVTADPASEIQGDTMTIRVASLSVSTLNTPVAQTIVAGTNNVAFANFVLDAASSGEDIKVTQIKVKHTTSAANIHNYITNLTLYDGSTALNTPQAGENSTTVSTATSTITLTNPLYITKGTTKTLALKGNVAGSAASASTHQFGLVSSTAVTAYGKSTGNTVTPSVTNSDGQTMTVATNASLTIAVSSASATSDGLLPANTSGLTIGVFNFRAQYADVNLEEIYLTVAAVNSGGPDQFNKVYLYDGTTKVAEATATTTDANLGTNNTVHFDMSGTPVLIAAGTNKDLTVKADTSVADYYNNSVNSKGESGEGFTLSINAVGDVVARSNGILGASNKTLNSATLKNYTLYKSVPTVLANDQVSGGIVSGTLLAGDTSNKDLYKFSVTADSAADVALYKVSFWVTTSTATATSWYLYEGGSQVAATTTTQVITDNDAGNVELVELVLTSDGVAPGTGNTNVVAKTISKGTTKTFTLKAGTLTGPSGTTSGSVQVQLLGDGAHPGTRPTSALTLQAQRYESNFVWGDLWRTYDTSSTTASTTEQWTNGYLVPTGATTKLQATSTAVSFSK